jgi:hypothetical protein
MPIDTESERVALDDAEAIFETESEELRALALERIYRLRRFRLHAIAFALGVPLLGGIWVLTEYFEEHTWPERFASAPDVAGTWETWFFWVAGIWAIILAVHALRAYFGPPIGPIGRYVRRPVSPDELDHAIKRLTSRRGR